VSAIATERETGPASRPPFLRSLAGIFLTGNTFVITVLAFFSALVIGAVIIVFATPSALQAWHGFFASPGAALGPSLKAIAQAYGSLFAGSIGSPSAIAKAFATGSPADVTRALTPISETLVAATPLMMAALGIALAFRAGLFDIGGQGQMILGAAGATLGGFLFPGMSAPLHIVFALLVGGAFGAAWGFIPGILKAKTGAHEVITSMMLNYVALNLLTYLLTSELYQAPPRVEAISKAVVPGARLPLLLGPSLRVNLGFVIAVLCVIGVAWLLKRSSTGFRFRMLGLNREAARVAGVNIERQYVLAMTLAGMLVGLGGALLVQGVDFRISPLYGGSIGFDGITVAILGRGSPLGVALSSLLFGAFTAGGRTMQVNTSIPLQLVQVLQAVLVLFVAAPGVIRTIYRIKVLHGGGRIFGGWAG
jgi:simple sugar transport system permease protein